MRNRKTHILLGRGGLRVVPALTFSILTQLERICKKKKKILVVVLLTSVQMHENFYLLACEWLSQSLRHLNVKNVA